MVSSITAMETVSVAIITIAVTETVMDAVIAVTMVLTIIPVKDRAVAPINVEID